MFDPTSDERTWQNIYDSSGIDDQDQVKFLANRSFRFFAEHVLGLNTNSPVIQRSIEFHQNPDKYSETDDGSDSVKAAIMAPRGHSKTFSWTIAPLLWRAYRETGSEYLLTSASHSQSKDILEDLKRIIELNEALQHLRPSTDNLSELGETVDIEDWQDTWKAGAITTTTDVTIRVKTFSDSIRSKHVDGVFCDDVLSNGMRKEEEKDVFYSVLSPIIENSGGLLQIVGTPLEYNDLMMELMEKDNFYTEKYEAYNPETEEVLWPDMWTYDGLMDKKAEIGPARFTREYMTEPMSVEEQFFKDEVIETACRAGDAWMRNPHSGDSESWDYFLGVDVALSDGADADFTVFTVLGADQDGQKHLVNMVREKGMSPSGIAQKINDLDNFYHFNAGLVEKNAIGEGVWRTIEEESKAVPRVEPFDTTRKTRPEILSSLQAALVRGELTLHDYEPLVRELRSFHMNSKGKLEGREHDDTVMSLAIAYRCVDSGGSQASFTIIGQDDEVDDNKSEVKNGKHGGGFVSSQDSSSDINIGIV